MEIPAFAGMTFVRWEIPAFAGMTFDRWEIPAFAGMTLCVSRLNELERPTVRVAGNGFASNFIT
jgi:hypothetical protein